MLFEGNEMAKRDEVVRDCDREYAEYQECIRQDFGDDRSEATKRKQKATREG